MSASVDQLLATATDVRSAARALRPESPMPVTPARSRTEIQAMLAALRAQRERLERVC